MEGTVWQIVRSGRLFTLMEGKRFEEDFTTMNESDEEVEISPSQGVMLTQSIVVQDSSSSKKTSSYHKSQENLMTLVENLSLSELDQALDGLWNHHWPKLDSQCMLDFVLGLLHGSSSPVPGNIKKWEKLYTKVIQLICTTSSSENRSTLATSLVRILQREGSTGLNALSIPIVVEALVNAAIPTTESPNDLIVLELLPLFLRRVSAECTELSSLATQEDLHLMSGSEYKTHVISNLCTRRWTSAVTTKLISVSRDIQMTSDEEERWGNKVLRQLSTNELEELPALVYQIFLYAGKVSSGNKKILLQGLLSHLASLEKRSEANTSSELTKLRIIQANILAHFSFVVKQDRSIGDIILKQGTSTSTGCFYYAMLLSMATIQQYEPPVLSMLTKALKEPMGKAVQKGSSAWITSMTSENSSLTKSSTMQDDITSTVLNVKFGWEHILPSLVKLALALVDGSNIAASFGVQLLVLLFRHYDVVRSHVLQHSLSMIVSRNSSDKTTVAVRYHYIEALRQISSSCAPQLLCQIDQLKASLEYLSYLEPEIAAALVNATKNLWVNELRDHLILILRKAIFSTEASKRIIAVNGFLTLVSGVTSDKTAFLKLFYEVTNFFRRCLSQQVLVRLSFYEGALRVFKKCPLLRPGIADIMLPHFMSYYESGNEAISPPLKMERMFSRNGVVEYFPSLLNCTLQCLQILDTEETDCEDDDEALSLSQRAPTKVSYSDLTLHVNTMVQRLKRCELDDFELDKLSSFSKSTAEGEKNIQLAEILVGIYECMLNHSVVSQRTSLSLDAAKDAVSWYLRLNEVQNLRNSYKEVAKKSKKNDDDTSSDKSATEGTASATTTAKSKSTIIDKSSIISHNPFVQSQSLLLILRSMYGDDDDNEAAKVLRSANGFDRYLLLKTQEELSRRSDDSLEFLKQLAPLLFSAYASSGIQENDETLVGEKEDASPPSKRKTASAEESSSSTTTTTALVVLKLMHLALVQSDDESSVGLNEFLMLMAPDIACTESTTAVVVSAFVERFQLIFNDLLQSQKFEDAYEILSIIEFLSQKLHRTNECCKWITNVCTGSELPNFKAKRRVVELILTLFIQLHQNSDNVDGLFTLSRALRTHYIDTEDDPELRLVFSILGDDKCAEAALKLFFAEMEREASEVDSVIKQNLGSRDDERIYKRLEQLSICVAPLLDVFTLTALQATSLLRVLIHIYKLVSALIKIKATALSSSKKVLEESIPVHFEELLNQVSTLTPAALRFVNQQSSVNMQQEKLKMDQKKRKKAKVVTSGQQRRHAKTVPVLIYQIEQLDVNLIKLSKRKDSSGNRLNVQKWCQRRQARDFRINADKLQEVFDIQEDDSDEENAKNK